MKYKDPRRRRGSLICIDNIIVCDIINKNLTEDATEPIRLGVKNQGRNIMSSVHFHLKNTKEVKDLIKNDDKPNHVPDFLGYRASRSYGNEDGDFYIHLNLNPLNLDFSTGLTAMLSEVSKYVETITAKVDELWVSTQFPRDGEVYTHGTTRCVVEVVYHQGSNKREPRYTSTLKVSGDSLSSIVCLIRKMKTGSVKPLEVRIRGLQQHVSVLKTSAQVFQSKFDNHIDESKETLTYLQRRLDKLEAERNKTEADLGKLVGYLELGFWKRLFAEKPDVYKKFRLKGPLGTKRLS